MMNIIIDMLGCLFPFINFGGVESNESVTPEIPEIGIIEETFDSSSVEDILEVGDEYEFKCENSKFSDISVRLVETRGNKFVVEVSAIYTGVSSPKLCAYGDTTEITGLHIIDDSGTIFQRVVIEAGATIELKAF